MNIRLQNRRNNSRSNQRLILIDRKPFQQAEQQGNQQRSMGKEAAQPYIWQKFHNKDKHHHASQKKNRIHKKHTQLIPSVHVDILPDDRRKIQNKQTENQPRTLFCNLLYPRPQFQYRCFDMHWKSLPQT